PLAPPPIALADPAPGTPLMCAEGSCGGCVPCLACVLAPACPEPLLPHMAPRGFCCYTRAEYLFWWLAPQDSPQLFIYPVRDGTRAVTADSIDNEQRVGGRVTLGHWLNFDQNL